MVLCKKNITSMRTQHVAWPLTNALFPGDRTCLWPAYGYVVSWKLTYSKKKKKKKKDRNIYWLLAYIHWGEEREVDLVLILRREDISGGEKAIELYTIVQYNLCHSRHSTFQELFPWQNSHKCKKRETMFLSYVSHRRVYGSPSAYHCSFCSLIPLS